jgi:hypothetical protein
MAKKSDGKSREKRTVTNSTGERVFYNPPRTVRRHGVLLRKVRVHNVPPTRK